MAEKTMEWLSEAELEEVLALPGAALTVFVTQWCTPCLKLMPRLEKVFGQEAACRCYLVDSDHHPGAAQKYNVRGVPTLLLFVDGDLEASRVGAIDDDQLQALVSTAH